MNMEEGKNCTGFKTCEVWVYPKIKNILEVAHLLPIEDYVNKREIQEKYTH